MGEDNASPHLPRMRSPRGSRPEGGDGYDGCGSPSSIARGSSSPRPPAVVRRRLRVLPQVRSHSLIRQTPLLFLSGWDDYKARYQGLELGADDFVSKQTPARELLIRIQVILKRYVDMGTRGRSGPAGMQGELNVMGAPGVLQVCHLTRLTGTLSVTDGGRRMAVRFPRRRDHRRGGRRPIGRGRGVRAPRVGGGTFSSPRDPENAARWEPASASSCSRDAVAWTRSGGRRRLGRGVHHLRLGDFPAPQQSDRFIFSCRVVGKKSQGGRRAPLVSPSSPPGPSRSGGARTPPPAPSAIALEWPFHPDPCASSYPRLVRSRH